MIVTPMNIRLNKYLFTNKSRRNERYTDVSLLRKSRFFEVVPKGPPANLVS